MVYAARTARLLYIHFHARIRGNLTQRESLLPVATKLIHGFSLKYSFPVLGFRISARR